MPIEVPYCMYKWIRLLFCSVLIVLKLLTVFHSCSSVHTKAVRSVCWYRHEHHLAVSCTRSPRTSALLETRGQCRTLLSPWSQYCHSKNCWGPFHHQSVALFFFSLSLDLSFYQPITAIIHNFYIIILIYLTQGMFSKKFSTGCTKTC